MLPWLIYEMTIILVPSGHLFCYSVDFTVGPHSCRFYIRELPQPRRKRKKYLGKKNARKFQEAKLVFVACWQYFHGIYTVLDK